MKESREIRIKAPILTRVEGEGVLELHYRNEVLEKALLRIFEPPRLFEKFLEGKHFSEQPIIAARICGICPIAYQMTGVRAMEKILGVQQDTWNDSMRRVLQCGEWLQSHALHIHFLALPDFLGCSQVLEMSEKYPEAVRRGMRLQALGNELIALSGARPVHPVGLQVGGFHRAPEPQQVSELQLRLETALQDAEELVRWLAQLELPEDHQEFVSVALHHPSQYALNEGDVRTSTGLSVPPARFLDYFTEHQVPHSTALYCLLDDQPYLVGPLARMNLNFNQLPAEVQRLADSCAMHFPSGNMYHSLLARGLECYFAVHEARRLLCNYQPQSTTAQISPRSGWGAHCTEAPRGLIFHRYQLDDEGFITQARIIPPTSQNQARIETDLQHTLSQFDTSLNDQEMQFICERLIRNYDPCISCSVHSLKLRRCRDQER